MKAVFIETAWGERNAFLEGVRFGLKFGGTEQRANREKTPE